MGRGKSSPAPAVREERERYIEQGVVYPQKSGALHPIERANGNVRRICFQIERERTNGMSETEGQMDIGRYTRTQAGRGVSYLGATAVDSADGNAGSKSHKAVRTLI